MHRHLIIDAVKALAAQVIVWHHLLIYAPMAKDLNGWAPLLVEFLQEHGRLAVQPFLVMGGFLTMQALARGAPKPWLLLIWRRFWRLAMPLWIALVVVLGVTAVWGQALRHADWVSPVPNLFEWALHLFLLQDLWGVPAISAGVWYVSIDFQLYALMAGLLVGLRRWGWQHHFTLVLMLTTLASLMVFSKIPALDVWGIYFWAPYGMGALTALALQDRQARLCLGGIILMTLVDQSIDYRVRPLLAGATAVVIFACIKSMQGIQSGGWLLTRVRWLSDMSYGLFVGHFAMILLFSAWWYQGHLQGGPWALGVSLLFWLSAMALGGWIHLVSSRWLSTLRI